MENKQKRDLDVHDLNVDKLTNKEMDYVELYMERVSQENKNSILKHLPKREILDHPDKGDGSKPHPYVERSK